MQKSLNNLSRLNQAFAIAMVALLAFGGFSYWCLRQSLESSSWVVHTNFVLDRIEDLIVGSDQVETGIKGFLLTDEQEFLSTGNSFLEKFDFYLEDLKELVLDNPAQLQRVFEAENLFKKVKDNGRVAISLKEAGQQQEAVALLTGNTNRQHLNELRSLLTQMEDAEQVLLKQRTSDKEASVRQTALFIILGTLFGATMIWLSRRVIVKDLKARQKVENELKETQQRFQIISQATQDSVWDWNLTNNHLWWNDGIQTMFHYDASDVVPSGDWWVDRIHPEDKEKVIHDIHEVIENSRQTHWNGEYRFRKKDGSYCEVFDRGFVIRDDSGKGIRMMGSMMDVTEIRNTQRDLVRARETAIETARLKSEFLANMSHEIRTPMNGVIGMTGLLLDTSLDERQHEYAETIRQCGDSLLTIINDILDFSKIEAGKLEIEETDFELTNLIESSVELLAQQAHQKGLELVSFIDPKVPRFLVGDSGRVRQILMNLLGNALKFTSKGEVLLQVSTDFDTENRVRLKFEVKDTGIGISKDNINKLFQPFSQTDGSMARKFGGTGLGLAISKQLVTLMSGEMGVESQLQAGSNFWFALPFSRSTQQQSQTPTIASNLQGLRCLVVDDNVTNQRIVHHQILSWGMRNGSPATPQEALQVLRKAALDNDPYDLAILDMHMPEMTGLELASEIKNDSLLSHTQVVLMSSVSRVGSAQELKEAGIRASLTKPVKQSHLYNCLLEVMSGTENKRIQRSEVLKVTSLIKPSAQSFRILVAEDNPTNQKIAAAQLAKLGYKSDVVANGLEALEALSRIPYDLVLMDCQMPEMDGYAATQNLRKLSTSARNVIVIAMTANAIEGDREKCLAAGMDDHIAKPVKLEVLAHSLEFWLQRKSLAA